MQQALCFDDVLLAPHYSEISSRIDVDLSPHKFALKFHKQKFSCPIVGSPMDTVMGPKSAATLANMGGLGVLHRYCTIEESKKMYVETISLITNDNYCNNVMVAIGATGDYLDRTISLYDVGCRAFCIDVAHGHHIHVKKALGVLRSRYGKDIHIMTGNVATLEAFNDLAGWGSDSIRVGVGGGSMCTTRIRTGHGVPTLQSIFDCAKSRRDVCLIADGGIRNSGDAVKALAAGADMVMLGSVLSGHDESPGELVDVSGADITPRTHPSLYRKRFRGMASREAQLEWRGKVSVVEGESTLVPYRGSLADTVTEFLDGIRSGLSYSGALSIEKLRANAKFVTVTSQGVRENVPHGKV